MVININPNRINIASGTGSRSARRESQEQDNAVLYKAPQRSEVNYIPAPETLRTLISSAVASLRKGVYWDRGTILNLLV